MGATATTATMSQPPPPPPSRRRPPPPPPPKQGLKRKALEDKQHAMKTAKTDGKSRKRSGNPPPPPATQPAASKVRRNITIRKPVVLRDVSAFPRRNKVGQGTYGIVFMGSDRETGEIVALKRINTEQEENGFPLTALREVKILKALEHENIVKLKEIVTSKGM